MYVCMCNGVTESAIRRAAAAGIRTLGELAANTGCTAGCGCCSETAEAVLLEALHAEGHRRPAMAMLATSISA